MLETLDVMWHREGAAVVEKWVAQFSKKWLASRHSSIITLTGLHVHLCMSFVWQRTQLYFLPLMWYLSKGDGRERKEMMIIAEAWAARLRADWATSV